MSWSIPILPITISRLLPHKQLAITNLWQINLITKTTTTNQNYNKLAFVTSLKYDLQTQTNKPSKHLIFN